MDNAGSGTRMGSLNLKSITKMERKMVYTKVGTRMGSYILKRISKMASQMV